MSTSDKRIVLILGAILAVLTAAYVYGVGTQLEEMLRRPVRISYFIADLLVLYPLGIVTIVGLIRGTGWRYRWLHLTLGALLFDMAHQMIYLFRDNYFEAHLALPVILFLLIVAFTIYVLVTIKSQTTNRENG